MFKSVAIIAVILIGGGVTAQYTLDSIKEEKIKASALDRVIAEYYERHPDARYKKCYNPGICP